MMIHIYGIPNCHSVKKALDFLKQHKQKITFHDFKKEGVDPVKLKDWCKAPGWQTLLNKKGTTWRGLTPEVQATAASKAGAVKLMLSMTSLIKRPVIEWPDGSVTVGLDEAGFLQKLR